MTALNHYREPVAARVVSRFQLIGGRRSLSWIDRRQEGLRMDGTARYGGWLLTGTVMGMILGAGVGTLIGAAAAPWSAGSVPLLAIACAAAGMLPGANLGWRLAWRLAGRPVEPM